MLIENFHELPNFIKASLNGEHPHFLDSIRLYNGAFQMTPFKPKKSQRNHSCQQKICQKTDIQSHYPTRTKYV